MNWDLIKDSAFNGLAFIFVLIIIYSLIPTKAQDKKKTVSVSAVILAIFFAVLGNPDRIASLKIWGFETQTRELTRTIDDAKEAIRQIRELAVAAATALIRLRENSHALLASGPGQDEYNEQDEFKETMIGALKKMGLPQEQLSAVIRSDRDVVLNFYANAAYRFGRNALPQSKWNDIDSAYYHQAAKQPLSPDECQALLDSFHIDVAKFADYMDDFRYYVKTGEQRRPEVWAHRETWGFGNLP
jgi:hypothetical protein